MIRVRSSSCAFFSFAVRTFSTHTKNPNHVNNMKSIILYVEYDNHRLTLFPVPLPTGGWHSQACRMAHSMISTRAVSWRSVRAKNHRHRKLLTIWRNKMAHLQKGPLSSYWNWKSESVIVWKSGPSPSSPGMGSSSSRLIMVSQSFNSSDAHSHKLSTK